MLRSLPIALALAAPLPAMAQEGAGFVEANILGIFYHELGHAVIDTERVPVFGQEEDAADVFSIFMIDAMFDGETARALALDAVSGFEGEAMMREREADGIAWWDTHGPDEQRGHNTACIFYGADPDARESFARDAGLPDERAESCAEEYDQALDSWGPVLDAMAEVDGRPALRFAGRDGEGEAALTARVLAGEIRAINAEVRLAMPVTVSLERCGEANAFYDPEALRIVFCTEFEPYLRTVEGMLFD